MFYDFYDFYYFSFPPTSSWLCKLNNKPWTHLAVEKRSMLYELLFSELLGCCRFRRWHHWATHHTEADLHGPRRPGQQEAAEPVQEACQHAPVNLDLDTDTRSSPWLQVICHCQLWPWHWMSWPWSPLETVTMASV